MIGNWVVFLGFFLLLTSHQTIFFPCRGKLTNRFFFFPKRHDSELRGHVIVRLLLAVMACTKTEADHSWGFQIAEKPRGSASTFMKAENLFSFHFLNMMFRNTLCFLIDMNNLLFQCLDGSFCAD